jgi:uncharacterized protein YkwD
LRPIRTVRAGLPAPFASLGNVLSSHPAITRLAAAALFFAAVIAFSQQTPAQAGPELEPPASYSLLPQAIGTGVPSNGAVVVEFTEAMDTESVENALALSPAVEPRLSWNPTGTRLWIRPADRWQTDSTYTIAVGEAARTADGDPLPREQRYAFSTQTAPVVTDVQLRLAVGPTSEADAQVADLTSTTEADASASSEILATSTSQTARTVSAATTVRINFSAEMDRQDVESHFLISPEVQGELMWIGNDLIFTPTERLKPGGRYTISVVGARDALGNELGGKPNFSFVVREGAQVTKTTPEADASDVDGGKVEIWFSQPMDIDATGAAFSLANAVTGDTVAGTVSWNDAGTKLVFRPAGRLAGSTAFVASLEGGARDADGNTVTAEVAFTTKAVPVPEPEPAPQVATQADPPPAAPGAPAPAAPTPKPVVVAPAAPSSNLAGYALNQINAARAAYGKPPLVLDGGLSASASAHAHDQLNRGYYAHSRNPGTYSAWGENQCHRYGWSAQKTMDWCHSVFMSEPYPGGGNHKDNILSDRYTRVGVGVADNGRRVVITWQFAR